MRPADAPTSAVLFTFNSVYQDNILSLIVAAYDCFTKACWVMHLQRTLQGGEPLGHVHFVPTF